MDNIINNIITSIKNVFYNSDDAASQTANNKQNQSNLSIFAAELKKEKEQSQLNTNNTFSNDTENTRQITSNKQNRSKVNLSVFTDELKRQKESNS